MSYKILFITHYSDLYGANRSLLTIIQNLDKKYEAHVLMPRLGPLTILLKSLGIPYHIREFKLAFATNNENNKFRFLSRLRYYPRLVKLILQLKPDLIYSNSSVIDYGAVLGWLFKTPHLWHIREFGEIHYKIFYDGPKFLRQFLMAQSTKTIAISEAVKIHLKNEKLATNIITIYNGVIKNSDLAVKPRRISAAINLSIVGLISENKGQLNAVNEFLKVVRYFPTIRLNIFGSGDIQIINRIKEIVSINNLKSQIEMHGFINDTKQIYDNTDILLMCSEYEAMGRVTVEAMANGIPVIGRNSGATPELVQDGIHGYLYNTNEELSERIIQLLNSPDTYFKMSSNCLDKAKHGFTIEEYTTKINNLIWNAINKKTGPFFS